MFEASRSKSGRFVKKNTSDKIRKALKSMSNAKQIKTTANEIVQSDIPDENSIVSLRELSKNLKCTDCRSILDMEKLTDFKNKGLHSMFTIVCEICAKSNVVNTGIINNKVSDINLSIILGSIHAGVGNTSLNKILACANLPRVTDHVYKQYESIIGKAIETEARESCKRAALEEKELVIKNVKTLCDTLPENIAQDIFPQLDILNHSSTTDNFSFDNALGEIINIIVSFDMAWSKRGNGRSYDSLNGYSTIIGFLSGKILDYATRNRKCKKCDLGYKKEDHDCRLNFHGSAKAMEPDTGVQLVNHSSILKETGLQVRVIIGDEDSSMIAAVRADEPNKNFHKLADKNHLTKNFANELYKLRDKFKELKKKDVIPHIKKCFTYAVAQNRGKPEYLAINLNQIPSHIFSQHENCGIWCNPNKKHTLHLSDEALYKELVELFKKYASNAHKFSIAASSQGNESFNNIVANKGHKNKCLSTTSACDIRVAAAVCVKNDGENSMLSFRQRMHMPIGSRTTQFVRRSELKRQKRIKQASLKEKKLRRIELKKKRELLRKTTEKAEGNTYESNCGINKLTSDECEDCDSILQIDTNIVYFDIETTGLAADAHILQIAAVCDSKTFNVYINTKKNISTSATAITHLCHKDRDLFHRGKKVEALNIFDALKSFENFLFDLSDGKKKCLLVAHNAPFDVPRLLRAIKAVNVLGLLELISGFADTLALFRKTFPGRKGPGQFKLETLSKDFLQTLDDQQSFHDATYDVLVLQTLTKTLKIETNLFKFYKSCSFYLQEISRSNKIKLNLRCLTELYGIVSMNMCKKFASNDISFDSLKKIYKDGGDEAVIRLLTEKLDNKKVRITKKKDIITKVLDFLKKKTL